MAVWVVGLLLEGLKLPLLLCSVPLLSREEQLSGWLEMTCWCGYRVAQRAHSYRTRVIICKLWQVPPPLQAFVTSEVRRQFVVDP
jgi:hypothetical protein